MNNMNGVALLDVLSFYIGIKNLGMNISQSDLQNQTTELDKKLDKKLHEALNEIHKHLKIQDQKIDYLIEILEELKERK